MEAPEYFLSEWNSDVMCQSNFESYSTNSQWDFYA